METNTKPLYKILNEERPQGEWHIINWGEQSQLRDGNKNELAMFNRNGKFDSGIPNTEWSAAANYTALAVNNLHHLAEALENIISEWEQESKAFTILTGDTIQEPENITKAKEALNRIS